VALVGEAVHGAAPPGDQPLEARVDDRELIPGDTYRDRGEVAPLDERDELLRNAAQGGQLRLGQVPPLPQRPKQPPDAHVVLHADRRSQKPEQAVSRRVALRGTRMVSGNGWLERTRPMQLEVHSMPSPAPRTHIARPLGVVLGLALGLAVPAASAIGADDDGTGWLCEATTIEAINAIGPLQFEDSGFGGPASCFLEASSGSATLALGVSGISFDLVRESSPDVVEVMVGDRPAVAAEGFLHVGLEEGILTVNLALSDPDAIGDIDPVEYAVDVAEVVVPALEASQVADGGPTSASTLGPPPEVAGIDWPRSPDVVSAEQLIEADEQQALIWQPLLDAAGVDATQLFTINANARDAESGDIVGNYAAIQLVGIDEERLRSALIDWLRTQSADDEVVTEDITLGGKDVTRLSVGGELRGYLYLIGDTAHALTMPDDAVARVLEALP
jgi:hypothetical protein